MTVPALDFYTEGLSWKPYTEPYTGLIQPKEKPV
jgi:hypothetical protein